MFRSTFISILAGVFILAGCSEEERSIRIGSKSFGESRILALHDGRDCNRAGFAG